MFASLKRMWSGSPRDNLIAVVGKAEIPQLPTVTMKVLSALRDPDTDNNGVACLVESDAGLSLKVLRTVNSAGYGLRKPIDNIRHAVAVLGRGNLETMVLSAAVTKALPAGGPGFNRRRFWAAAARRAATARCLADVVEPRSRLVSFTAGLLQDMAVPLLASTQGADYQRLLDQWNSEGGALDDIERSHFDWDHALVAGWLCEEWSFPETLASAIAGHHAGTDAPPAVQLVGMLHERDHGDDEAIIDRATSVFGANPDEVATALALGREQGGEFASQFFL